jgi:hypothetical protein
LKFSENKKLINYLKNPGNFYQIKNPVKRILIESYLVIHSLKSSRAPSGMGGGREIRRILKGEGPEPCSRVERSERRSEAGSITPDYY